MWMRIQDPEFFWPWIRDPRWKNSDPGQTPRIRNTERLNKDVNEKEI
jgi:hypothetical protein